MNNKKPKLVCVGETFLTKPADHHRPWFEEYFDVSEYSDDKEYDSTHTFIYKFKQEEDLVKKYRGTGCKFIADGLWEVHFFCGTDFDQDTLPIINNGQFDQKRILRVPKFFWFEEYLSQHHRKEQVTSWPCEHDKTADFLMLIGKHTVERQVLLNRLEQLNLLDKSLYSVLFKGKSLERKIESYIPAKRDFSQRHYESDWYNSTHYSLVVESIVYVDGFVTEKTFKPIMYGHPFMIFGNPGSLRLLESWGFKTFEDLFDQSYDLEQDNAKRLELITAQIQNFKSVPETSVQKIKHNFDRFWNDDVVRDYYYQDLILPILNFVTD